MIHLKFKSRFRQRFSSSNSKYGRNNEETVGASWKIKIELYRRIGQVLKDEGSAILLTGPID